MESNKWTKTLTLYKIRNSFLIIRLIFFGLLFRAADAQINAFRVESSDDFNVTSDGRVAVPSGKWITLRLFGSSKPLDADLEVSFTDTVAPQGDNCDDLRSTNIFKPKFVFSDSAVVDVLLHAQQNPDDTNLAYLMFCVRQNNSDGSGVGFIHQGNRSWMQITALAGVDVESLLPIWGKSVLIVVFIGFSGLFTGLGLGLLSLTRLELKVLRSLGSPREKRYAKVVYPLRKKGNFLLCTITFANALANIGVTILFYELVGVWAVLGATLSIVFIGEILPQTVCSFFGLAVGTKIVWFTNFFMAVTCPITYPIGKLMDWVLREEIPSVYNRDRLQELVHAAETRAGGAKGVEGKGGGEPPHGAGCALNLSNKYVKDIMTRLEDVFMLEYNTLLSCELLGEIMKAGYTRVPVYDNDRSNIVAVLHIKDLALVDPGDGTSLRTLCKFHNRPVNFVFEDTKLDVMLEEFKKGQSHMAFLQRVNNEGPGDPFYETLGMLTLEDVIEEIFQSDYSDDASIVVEGKELVASLNKVNLAMMTLFRAEKKDLSVSPQMTQAACQFLASSVSPFGAELISEKVLRRLMHQNILVAASPPPPDAPPPAGGSYHPGGGAGGVLYEAGRACDYFVLLLEGHIETVIGKEGLVFDSGPFSFFGVQALMGPTPEPSSVDASLDARASKFIPDFTARASTNIVYARIPRALYTAARHATALEREALRNDGDDYAIAPPGDFPPGEGGGGMMDDSWMGLFRVEAPPYEMSASSRTRLLERGAGRLEDAGGTSGNQGGFGGGRWAPSGNAGGIGGFIGEGIGAVSGGIYGGGVENGVERLGGNHGAEAEGAEFNQGLGGGGETTGYGGVEWGGVNGAMGAGEAGDDQMRTL